MDVQYAKDVINKRLDSDGPNHAIRVHCMAGTESVFGGFGGFVKRSMHSDQNLTVCIIAPHDMNDDIREILKTLEQAFEQKHQR